MLRSGKLKKRKGVLSRRLRKLRQTHRFEICQTLGGVYHQGRLIRLLLP